MSWQFKLSEFSRRIKKLILTIITIFHDLTFKYSWLDVVISDVRILVGELMPCKTALRLRLSVCPVTCTRNIHVHRPSRRISKNLPPYSHTQLSCTYDSPKPFEAMSSTAATPRRGRPSGSSMAQPQSATSVGQSRAQLPPYEPPSQPLNPTAQFALQNLSHTHKLDSLKGHIRTANNLLAATAGEANDRLVSREGEWARKKAKREQNGSGAGNDGGQGEDQEGEKEMVDMRIRVQTLTDQLEEKVRGMVDLESGLEANEKVLADIGSGNAGGGKVMATQSSLGHSQFRQSGRRGRRGGVNGDDDEVDGGGADEGMDGNEDLMGSEGVADQFKKKLEEHEREYARLTMQSRYVLFWIDSSADAGKSHSSIQVWNNTTLHS